MKKSSKKNKKKSNKTKRSSIMDIVTRYLILVLAAIPGLWLFYFIFTPLTVYPVYFILNIFYETLFFWVEIPVIILNDIVPIKLISACIAGSAYYLLLILNLSTPGIKVRQRINSIIFSFAAFLVINIIRIIILSILAVEGSLYFDVTHSIFWYGLSTVIVVGIWFAEVKIYKIKDIPFYSDLKFLYRKTRK